MFNSLQTSVPGITLVNVPAQSKAMALLSLYTFETAVKAIASGPAAGNPSRIVPEWHASDVAPETYPELCKCFEAQQGMLTVWSGASGETIFSSPEVNHAFRAWHDFRHVTEAAPFTPEGELAVFRAQAADLRAYCDAARRSTATYVRLLSVLQADVVGQLMYQAKHAGEFPTNQRAFTLAFLQYGPETVSSIAH